MFARIFFLTIEPSLLEYKFSLRGLYDVERYKNRFFVYLLWICLCLLQALLIYFFIFFFSISYAFLNFFHTISINDVLLFSFFDNDTKKLFMFFDILKQTLFTLSFCYAFHTCWWFLFKLSHFFHMHSQWCNEQLFFSYIVTEGFLITMTQ